MSKKTKVHLLKEGKERTTLCSMTGPEFMFSADLNRVTCKKCLKIHRANVPQDLEGHQKALRRRFMHHDRTVFKCDCGRYYASVAKFEGHPDAPEKCFICRKIAESTEE